MKIVSPEQRHEIMAKLETEADWSQVPMARVQQIFKHPDRGGKFTRFLCQESWSYTFLQDMSKKGWTLRENTLCRIESVQNLELVPFVTFNNPCISGSELRALARNLGVNYGQEDAEFILQHKDEIPEEFQEYRLLFPGTVWSDCECYAKFPHLIFNDGLRHGPWLMGFSSVHDPFYSEYCFVRPLE